MVVRIGLPRVRKACTPGETGGVSGQDLVKVSSGLQQSCLPIEVVSLLTILPEAS